MGIRLAADSPPFPDPTVEPKVAKLQTVKFAPLLDRDATEPAKLVSACENDGFFYLDLSDRGADRLFQSLEEVSELVKIWIKQPREKKCQTVTSKPFCLLRPLRLSPVSFSRTSPYWKTNPAS